MAFSRCGRSRPGWAAATGLLLFARIAAAEPASLRIDCPGLSREQTAEIETRARAALLTAGLDAAELELGCEAEQARASLRARGEVGESALPLDAAPVAGQLMQALDLAIGKLSQPLPTEPQALAPSSAAFESDRVPRAPTPPQAAVSPSRPAARRTPRAARRRFSVVSVGIAGVAEAWGSRVAPGALLHSRFGRERVGVTWSASYQVAASALFRADELGVAFGVDYRPDRAAGITLEGDLGVSLLSVTPHAPYQPRGATGLSVGFLRLLLARPIALGRLALVPAAGVRLFAAPRRLRVDDEERLKLGYAVPVVLLSLSYLFD